MKNYLRLYAPVLLIIALSIFMRFIALDKIPNGINGDELIYPVTAKAIYLTGHDISGTWNPLSALLFRYPPGERQAELPYFLHLFISGPFPFSLFNAKLPFAILSVGIVIILYLIAKQLLGERAAITTGLLAAINPWLIVMGRTAFESTPATFFYLLALLMLLTMQSWRILFTILPLLLGFYSYIGTKLIFIPYIFICLMLARTYNKHKLDKYYAIIGFISLFVVGAFLILSGAGSSGSRLSEIITPQQEVFTSEVNQIRKISIQTPLLSPLINKYTVYVKLVTDKLFRVLSASYLFSSGDQFFLPARHSFFFAVDFVILLLGLLFMFIKKRLLFFFVCLYIVIGTFPQLFHISNGDFSIHNTMMFPFIIILLGFGISEIVHSTPVRYQFATIGAIGCIYLLSLSYFCLVYFYQYPLQDSGDFHMRLISKYLTIAKKSNTRILLYSNTSTDFLKKYIFYSNNLNASTIREINAINPKLSAFNFNGITFSSCDSTIDVNHSDSIHIVDTKCGKLIAPGPHIQIARLTDAGDLYGIYGDTVCSQFILKPYPSGISIGDFGVEQMNPQQFCETFISK